MKIFLTSQQTTYLEETIASGRFRSVSEAVREALHLLQVRDAIRRAKLGALREDIGKGIQSLDFGLGKNLDMARIKHMGRFGSPESDRPRQQRIKMLIVSPEAENDILAIWQYVAADDENSADLLLDQLYESVQRLVALKEVGFCRLELGKKIRSHPTNKYVLCYRPSTKGIEIVRVLCGVRDTGSEKLGSN